MTAVHFKRRMPSRGLHYHASTRNLPLIAAVGSTLTMVSSRVRNPDIGNADSKQAELSGAHEAAHRPFFTCVIPVLGCSVTTKRSPRKHVRTENRRQSLGSILGT